MAITIDLNLHPYGYGADPVRLGKISIHTHPSNRLHEYTIIGVDVRKDENFTIHGNIPKDKSGHKNILHVLQAVLNDAGLEDLGEDYIHTDIDAEIAARKAARNDNS